jgi:hypothetical protein
METSNIYIYIDKVIIVDNRLCLCHYAFCFLHMKCVVCVCVRGWVGVWLFLPSMVGRSLQEIQDKMAYQVQP